MHRCTLELCGIWARTCQEGAPAEVTDSRRILKVVEYLGGGYCAEEDTAEGRISEEFCIDLPGGHQESALSVEENSC